MWQDNANNADDAPRLIFAGGGTLGHLMPGVAVADGFLKRHPRARVLFVTAGNDNTREHIDRMLGRRGVATAVVSTRALKGGSLRGVPALTGGLFASLKLLRRFRPNAVVGLGGYVSVPTVLAAHLARVPTLLLEQNVRPGRANRLLARWARRVCCAWPGTDAHLPHPERVRFTGNPVRANVPACPQAGGADGFGDALTFRPRKKTLLIMGGSNGAASLNDMVLAVLPRLEGEADRLRIIHSTGTPSFERVRDAYARTGIDAMVVPFLEDMAAAYRACDLVVCRAGGTSLAEVCAAGRPALMVPYPYAAEDHQRLNAEVLERHGAGIILDPFETSPDVLCDEALSILRDNARRRTMAAHSLALGRPAATESVIAQIESLIGDADSAGEETREVA